MAAEPVAVHRVPKLRRSWQLHEEEVLLECLKELCATGWKSDNGFRAGYVGRLEELMRGHFPTANIRANPHIVSKLTGWKRNYGSLCSILARSGVGFNLHGDFTVDADDEQWEHICNVDANAKNIRGKAWPYYDRWAEAFGKDRATGETAEDVIDAVNELLNEEQHPMPNQPLPFHANSPEPTATYEPDTTDQSEVDSTRFEAGPSRSRKKRRINDATDHDLCEILGKMHSDTKVSLDSIAHRIGYQTDLGKARTQIWLMLEDIPDLGMEEKFDVSDFLIADPSMLEFFSGLPVLARAGYVHRLLLGRGV